MAEAKPGTKICDRCDTFRAKAYTFTRKSMATEAGKDIDNVVMAKADLCIKCVKLADKALERAVKPK
jgi:hypothetical protein